MINFVKTKVFYNSVLDQVCFWWTLRHHWCLFLIKCVNRNPLLTRSEEKLKLRRVFGGCCSMFWKHRRKDEQRMWTWQPPPTPSCGAKLWEQPCFHVHLWSAEQVCTLLQALITAELIRCFQALKGAESTSDLLFSSASSHCGVTLDVHRLLRLLQGRPLTCLCLTALLQASAPAQASSSCMYCSWASHAHTCAHFPRQSIKTCCWRVWEEPKLQVLVYYLSCLLFIKLSVQ